MLIEFLQVQIVYGMVTRPFRFCVGGVCARETSQVYLLSLTVWWFTVPISTITVSTVIFIHLIFIHFLIIFTQVDGIRTSWRDINCARRTSMAFSTLMQPLQSQAGPQQLRFLTQLHLLVLQPCLQLQPLVRNWIIFVTCWATSWLPIKSVYSFFPLNPSEVFSIAQAGIWVL